MSDRADETGILIDAKDPEDRKRILGDLFTGHRGRLRAMVGLRLDPRLRSRLDTSDVLQETYLEAQRRLDRYLEAPAIPLYLWLRRLAAQKLIDAQRVHLGAQKRAAFREVPLKDPTIPHATSEALALVLVEKGPSPSELAARSELKARLEAVLEGMEPIDRDILALRHFEQLTVPESAQALGIGEAAAQKRYLRALEKPRDILSGMPGIDGELHP
jgi:RNA polymerase sigma-70 factor, ECF subfamily